MASIRKKSASTPALVTNSAATYYTTPVSTSAKDITIDLYNAHTAAVGVTCYLVPSGGSASATNTIFSETSPGGMVLAPNEWRSVALDQSLSTGDFIQLKASVTSVISAHITITEVV